MLLVAPMRDVVLWKGEVAARETEAADKLRVLNEFRALNELRAALNERAERGGAGHAGPAPGHGGAAPGQYPAEIAVASF